MTRNPTHSGVTWGLLLTAIGCLQPVGAQSTPGADVGGGAFASVLESPEKSPDLPRTIEKLTVRGEDFLDPNGDRVRFWGVNLVALYPDHDVADRLSANLASRGINMVRPHHMLRRSKDWNWDMASGALALYDTDSRAPDPDAWDRFDYLNAALRTQGVYLAFALRWSRSYRPGDVAILETDDVDRDQWMAAMKELNNWHWQKSKDAIKALPMIDERVFALEAEFARRLLTHVNPFTGFAYGRDPQVVTLEVINEYSTEYTFVCNNKLPAYFEAKLQSRWAAFAAEAGVRNAGQALDPKTPELKVLRLRFFRHLDERYQARIREVVGKCGYDGAVTFSNLWRGDHNLEMIDQTADYVENHCYGDPLVVQAADDFSRSVNRSLLANKPFIVSEFNVTENRDLRQKRATSRTMMPVAAAAYGSFHNSSGVTWFAWQHGGRTLAADGWGREESRRKSNIGELVNDGPMIDHLRTAGLIFRRGYLQSSRQPKTLTVGRPFLFPGYHDLMRGKHVVQPGWQAIHSIRKAFGEEPAEQKTAPWLTAPPEGKALVSDTGQIAKDIERKQLTFSAPKAEGFSGYLDAAAPEGLQVLEFTDKVGTFVTVMVTTLDDQPLAKADRLLLSKTAVAPSGRDSAAITVSVRQRRASSQWLMRVTRPLGWETLGIQLRANETGLLQLPNTDWHECELTRQP